MSSRIASRSVTCGLSTSSLSRNFGSSQLVFAQRAVLWLGIFSALLLVTLQPAHAGVTESVLYNFTYSPDGGYPEGHLTFDSSGNLYGVTAYGGANYYGSVFELTPEPAGGCPSGTNPGSGWCETVLYGFCSVASCTDGYYPAYAYVTFDSAGNLYGTTSYGGANGYGAVFELSPEPLSGCPGGSNPGNGWCETVIYGFQNGSDGANPSNGLVWDSSGNLYGTTYVGANQGVSELSPNGSGGWTEQVIYQVCMDYAGLAIDGSGNLYGVDCENHVFKLSLANGVWTATNIHTFTGGPKDGLYPEGSPAVDSAGNVYGTTYEGGGKGYGTVWKLTPVTTEKKAGTYAEKILHFFTASKTGTYPWAGVTLDSSGNIYGTTATGGKYDDGTVFELAVSGASYKESLLWSFNDTDGYYPVSNPIRDSSGNLYGTTYEGGSSYGTVFEVKP